MKTIESRANLAFAEIHRIDPDPFTPVINKLIEISQNPNRAQIRALKRFAYTLCRIDIENSADGLKTPKGLSYDRVNKTYRAEKYIDGKRVHIKTSRNKEVAREALIQFCKAHDIG